MSALDGAVVYRTPVCPVVVLHIRAQNGTELTRRASTFLFSEPGGHFMSWVRLSRSLRVFAIATLCCASSVASLRADPIVVTSGRFATSTNEPTGFQFFGADGFFLGGIFPLVPTWPSLVCSTFTGCAPGTVVNMSTVAGGDPTPFLGLSTGAVINGTEFLRPFGLPPDGPRLLGTLRFDAPVVSVDGFTATAAPFVFNGVVSGFAHDDVDARAALFQVALTGQGTARLSFEDFDNNPALSGSFVTYTFAAAPAATPEPTTLVLFGTAVAGLVQRARRKRRRVAPSI
jgi:PEP-CTERM motif-containing protein